MSGLNRRYGPTVVILYENAWGCRGQPLGEMPQVSNPLFPALIRVSRMNVCSITSYGCALVPASIQPKNQNEVPPRSSLPFTVSQLLPGAGGVFHGHLAMAAVAMRDPKLLPSRSGFILTLNIVPAGKLAAVIPCC